MIPMGHTQWCGGLELLQGFSRPLFISLSERSPESAVLLHSYKNGDSSIEKT